MFFIFAGKSTFQEQEQRVIFLSTSLVNVDLSFLCPISTLMD
jgi:hypothetical protein